MPNSHHYESKCPAITASLSQAELLDAHPYLTWLDC